MISFENWIENKNSDTNIEYVIWGVPPNEEHENVLHTKSASMEEAKKIAKILEKEYGCTKTRIQVLDLSAKPDFTKIFNKKKRN